MQDVVDAPHRVHDGGPGPPARRCGRCFTTDPRGVRAGDLGSEQRERFDALLDCFVHRARPGLVGFVMDRIARAGGVVELHFAWAGGTTIEQPHYFRIQGPVTLVEFDNAEDDANHIHSVWRDPVNDFGADLLVDHYLQQHRPAPGTVNDVRGSTDIEFTVVDGARHPNRPQ